MKQFVIILALVVVIPIQIGYLYIKNGNNGPNGIVAGLETQQTKDVLNSLFIGEFRFTLFGYTSPKALVSLTGEGISDQTYADKLGYFEFTNRFLPLSPHEACLSATDQFGRTSAPTCLPPFPTQSNVVIGPVIIPPTISFDKPNYYVGDEAVLSGQTLPDSDINLSMFTQHQGILSKISSLSLIKPVEAFSLPKLSIKSDDKGNFAVSLPSSQAVNYRLFAQVDYQNLPSANSLALSLKILPIWMVMITFFLSLWNIIKDRLLEISISLEVIALLAYFLRAMLSPYRLSKNKAIVPYEASLPAKEEKYPLVVEN